MHNTLVSCFLSLEPHGNQKSALCGANFSSTKRAGKTSRGFFSAKSQGIPNITANAIQIDLVA